MATTKGKSKKKMILISSNEIYRFNMKENRMHSVLVKRPMRWQLKKKRIVKHSVRFAQSRNRYQPSVIRLEWNIFRFDTAVFIYFVRTAVVFWWWKNVYLSYIKSMKWSDRLLLFDRVLSRTKSSGGVLQSYRLANTSKPYTEYFSIRTVNTGQTKKKHSS